MRNGPESGRPQRVAIEQGFRGEFAAKQKRIKPKACVDQVGFIRIKLASLE
jgi:hypothetical protein